MHLVDKEIVYTWMGIRAGLENLREEGRPPWPLSQHEDFLLLLLLPPPLPGRLYLHMPGSGTNQRAAWGALNRGCRHFLTEALSSLRLESKAEVYDCQLPSRATRMERQMPKDVYYTFIPPRDDNRVNIMSLCVRRRDSSKYTNDNLATQR
ncbi:hypothetical protein VZT92_018823 [Zoarces viviparus]|uniref:Uncharacterized protein n=1 Tax=Zoarces viviparus TaxID=48416 RepID=A0AAW1EHZ9_ZOAVI